MAQTALTFFLLSSCLMLSQCLPAGPGTDNKLADLKASVEQLRRENIEIKARISSLEQLASGQPGDNGAIGRNPQYTLDSEPSVGAVRRKRATRMIRRLVRVPEVAFQAILEEKSKNFDVTKPLIFDTVLVEKKNSYNHATGVFTAPYSGTYIFNLNVLADKNNFVESAIKVNGRATVQAISDNRLRTGDEEYKFQQGSTNVILDLRKGDEISSGLTFPFQDSASLMGDGRTSFSGYMLRRHGRGDFERSTMLF